MDILQQLIEYSKAEKEKAKKKSSFFEEEKDAVQDAFYDGKRVAFSFIIEKAELLLKTVREQQPL